MKSCNLSRLFLNCICIGLIVIWASGIAMAAETSPVYRFLNSYNGVHFYTINESEKDNLINHPEWGYGYEGINFYAFEEEADYNPYYDSDNDGYDDEADNCPEISNSSQQDTDNDGIGDACDGDYDYDNDDSYDNEDNCLETPNPNQQDADDDGIGDACDEDTIYGYISGEFKEGIDVNITIADGTIIDTVVTDEDGYYSIGNLENDQYEVTPDDPDFVFFPKSASVSIPEQ